MMLRLVRASVRSGVGDGLGSWLSLRRYHASERGVVIVLLWGVVSEDVVLRVFWLLLVVLNRLTL